MNQNPIPISEKRGESNITEAMIANLKQTVMASYFIILLTTILVFIPSSEASFWRSRQKTVNIQNWDTTQISIRCFSFDDEREVHHLKPQEGFNFTFLQSVIFPSSTMWNCSTHQGAFIAFKNYYDCNKNQINLCAWRFSLKEAYRYSPEYNKWIRYEYNPNYESLRRGGVVKGNY